MEAPLPSSHQDTNQSSLGENHFGKYLLNRDDIYRKEEARHQRTLSVESRSGPRKTTYRNIRVKDALVRQPINEQLWENKSQQYKFKNNKSLSSLLLLKDKKSISNQQVLRQLSGELEPAALQQCSCQCKDTQNLHNVLNEHYLKNVEMQQYFQQKLEKLDELQDLIMSYDNSKAFKDQEQHRFFEAQKIMMDQLKQQSQVQIEFNRLFRDNKNKEVELISMRLQLQKTQEKNRYLQDQVNYLRLKHQDSNNEIMKQKRQLLDMAKQSEENQLKNKRIQRRLDVVLDLDADEISNNKEKRLLTIQELMRQNDSMNHLIKKKNNEIQVNQQMHKAFQEKIEKYLQIIRILKKNDRKIEPPVSYSMKESLIINEPALPENFQFLNYSQNQDTSNYIQELLYHGLQVYQTSEEYRNMEKIKQHAIIKQFIINQNLFNLVNQLLQQLFTMQNSSLNSLGQINYYLQLNLKKQVFNCDCLNLWEVQSHTGLLATTTQDKKNVQAFCDQGVFGECLRSRQGIKSSYQSKKLFYKLVEAEDDKATNVFKENFILIPLLSPSGDVFALLELSNETLSTKNSNDDKGTGPEQHEVKSFNLEEQYLSQVLRFSLQNLITTLKQNQVAQVEIQNNLQMQRSYSDMLSCSDQLQLTAMVGRKLRDIFSITGFRLFFQVQEKGEPVLQYYHQQENNHYQLLSIQGHKGIAGMTAKYKGPQIITNVRDHLEYDSTVDIYSLLPLYAIPILATNLVEGEQLCLGVLQMVMKQRIAKQAKKEQLLCPVKLGLEESTQNLVNLLVHGLSVAIQSLSS